MTLAERIILTCSTIQCNCVPYYVSGDQPIHIPPLNELDFLDLTNSDVSKELSALGVRCGQSDLYDIILANSDYRRVTKMLKPSGKMYAISQDRNRLFGETRSAGLTLINERNQHFVFRPPRSFKQPEWNNQKNINLLVYSGGGFGDDINGLRYIQSLKQLTKSITFEARPEMKSLLESCSDYDRVINKGEESNCDFVISLESLQNKLHRSTRGPFLKTPVPKEVLAGKKIAVAYQGHHVKYTCQRKYPPSTLIPLTETQYKVYCVQKLSIEEDIELPEGICDLGSKINNWLDTAMFVGQMDYVVTPDTSLFHLSAAMGIMTYVFLDQSHASHYCPGSAAVSGYYPKTTRLFWGNSAMSNIVNLLKT